jgi:MoaA/NifB/PqqE/SkfB family radical SAM enzyme
MCDIWKDRSKTEITAAQVREWLPDWKTLGVRQVVLTGGEPLMHTHLWDICALLREANIIITLLSTGLLLTRHSKMIVAYCDGVRVSLDGPPGLHDEIRRIPGAFGKLGAGIHAVKTLRSDFPVFARTAVHRRNFRHLRETIAAAHMLGCDRISFLATDVVSDAFNRVGGLDLARTNDLLLDAEDIVALKDEMDALERQCGEDFASGFINESPAELRARILQYYSAMLGQEPFAPNACNAPWISAVLQYDGTIRPCFFHKPYGKLDTTTSMSSLVNSPSAIDFRQRLDVRTDDTCRRCVCTFAAQRCMCGASRAQPFCDKSCILQGLTDSPLGASAD